jgi:DNA-binding transcriptional LysR family regulator
MMMTNLSSANLEAFFTVSQTLNFTKAAEKLHITQSALSQRILNLEKELELTLFIRDRSGLRLTEAATKLVRYCQQKNNLELEVMNSIRPNDPSNIAGVVRIGGFSSVMSSIVVRALGILTAAHKNISIQTTTKEMSQLLELLKRGEIDYMIVDDRINREELDRIALGKEKNVLVQHKKYMGDDIYLDHDEDDEVTIKYLKHAKLKTKDIRRQYLDDVHGLIQGVQHKLGKAVLPLHLIEDKSEFQILNPTEVLEIPIYLYYYSQPYYSNLHFKVVEALTTTFAKVLR